MDEDTTQSIFAYGSNMDPVRLLERCPSARDRRPGRLLDHRLVFDKIALERDGTGYANVVRAKGEEVEGVLVEVSRDDLEYRLDRVEGHPRHYSRRLMAIEEPSGERAVAWVYFATPEFRAAGLVPQRDYLEHLLAGRDLLSPDYVARLEALRDTL